MAQLYGFQSEAFKAAVAAAKEYRDELMSKPGVVGVRAGYRVVNRWLTTTPAVVVSVNRKKLPAELSEDERVPEEVGGVPTDVAPASAKEIRAAEKKEEDDILDTADAADAGPGILEDVTLDESAAGVGKSVDSPAADAADKTRYEKPPDLSLQEFPLEQDGTLEVLCHAGPDAGWPKLSEFLSETEQKLTIAIYDFKAPHIIRAIRDAKPAGLEMVIDPGLTEPERAALGELSEDPDIKPGLDVVLASVSNAKGKEGVFSTAYHTKVVVRDGRAFWLSSGNMSPSSQPDADPFKSATAGAGLHKRANREYHVIVPHEGLARTLEQYIEWDRKLSRQFPTHTLKPAGGGNADNVNADDSDADALAAATRDQRPDLLIARDAYEAFFAADAADTVAPPPRFFKPEWITLRREDGDYALPLLTQDNYIEKITELVRGAQKKLYLQFQYVRLRGDTPDKFRQVILLLKEKIDKKLDVRVIIGHHDVRRDLENLVGIELDISHFKVQVNCHNKTLLVDDRFVTVGSQNWSGDGTTRNRDASILFRSRAVYDYYERIFIHDWERLASQDIRERLTPVPADANAPTPDGMIRLGWYDVYDEG